jgi:polyhydroxyalkanoate synthase subunit PhaC
VSTSQIDRHDTGDGVGLPDLVTAGEALVPDAVLARVDPALWGRTSLQVALGLARHPLGVAGVLAPAALESARVGLATVARALGADVEGPVELGKDPRFKDPAWTHNPVYYGWRQQYLLTTRVLDDLVRAAGLDADTEERARFVAGVLAGALAPTNVLPGNPAALKKAFDTGGGSLVAGARNVVDDVLHNGGLPRQVDTSGFELGENIAVTPGSVVYRNELVELIQYDAQTDEVGAVPILCSPPWINKYYIMDLAPGRSFVEWAVQHGHTVFMLSYLNPGEEMAETTLDDYLDKGPRAALDVIAEITGAERINVVGLCLGGALASITAAQLGGTGDERVNSLTLLNTLLDYREPGPLGSFVDPDIVERLERQMSEQGYLEGSSMATTFDLLRADDLIFNYVGPNWLQGEDPPAFDLLVWNSDSTRMPAAMQTGYLHDLYLENQLARGEFTVHGTTVSLGDVTADTMIIAARNDHIAPWTGSFRSTELLGGEVTFVLSTAGHIAGVVNPPSDKAKHWVGGLTPGETAEQWEQRATEKQGSWWETWAEWIGERAGKTQAPPSTGSEQYPPLGPAPGTYVRG